MTSILPFRLQRAETRARRLYGRELRGQFFDGSASRRDASAGGACEPCRGLLLVERHRVVLLMADELHVGRRQDLAEGEVDARRRDGVRDGPMGAAGGGRGAGGGIRE